VKQPTVAATLAAYKKINQPVQVELRPDGTTAFIPVVPEAPQTGHDPVLEALRRAS
jgi:hypothetical protein